MPIEKKEIDDKTISELWGPGKPDADKVDKPDKDKVDKPVDDKDKDTDKPDPAEAKAAEERISSLLDKHGFDDFEELIDALEESEEFVQKLGNRDLDQLIKDADYLDTMQKWQADVSTKGTPKPSEDDEEDDRVSRLEKTIKVLLDEKNSEKEAKTRAEESKRVLDGFKNLVTSTLDEQKVPDEHKPFLMELLGVDHPTLDVDLDNKVAVRKALKGGVKKYNDFVTTIIEGYRKGKIKIPEITPTEKPPAEEPTKVKDLSHARKIAAELISGRMFRK